MAKLVPNQGAKTPFRRTSNAVQGVITSLARKSQASQRLARVAGRSQEAWAKVAGVAANVIGANIQENRAYEERIRRKKESITKQRTNLAFESVREQGKTEARVAAKKGESFDLTGFYDEQIVRVEQNGIQSLGDSWSPEGFEQEFTKWSERLRIEADRQSVMNQETILSFQKEQIKSEGILAAKSFREQGATTTEDFSEFYEMHVAPVKEQASTPTERLEAMQYASAIIAPVIQNNIDHRRLEGEEKLTNAAAVGSTSEQIIEIAEENDALLRAEIGEFVEEYGEDLLDSERRKFQALVDTPFDPDSLDTKALLQKAAFGGKFKYSKALKETRDQLDVMIADPSKLDPDSVMELMQGMEGMLNAAGDEGQREFVKAIGYDGAVLMTLAPIVQTFKDNPSIETIQESIRELDRQNATLVNPDINTVTVYRRAKDQLNRMLQTQDALKKEDPYAFYAQGAPEGASEMVRQKVSVQNQLNAVDRGELEIQLVSFLPDSIAQQNVEPLANALETGRFNDIGAVLNQLSNTIPDNLLTDYEARGGSRVDVRDVLVESIVKNSGGRIKDRQKSRLYAALHISDAKGAAEAGDFLETFSGELAQETKDFIKQEKENIDATIGASEEWGKYFSYVRGIGNESMVKRTEDMRQDLVIMAHKRMRRNESIDFEEAFNGVVQDYFGDVFDYAQVNGRTVAVSRINQQGGPFYKKGFVSRATESLMRNINTGSGVQRMLGLSGTNATPFDLPFNKMTDVDGNVINSPVLPRDRAPTEQEVLDHNFLVIDQIRENGVLMPIGDGRAFQLMVESEGARYNVKNKETGFPVVIGNDILNYLGTELEINPITALGKLGLVGTEDAVANRVSPVVRNSFFTDAKNLAVVEEAFSYGSQAVSNFFESDWSDAAIRMVERLQKMGQEEGQDNTRGDR